MKYRNLTLRALLWALTACPLAVLAASQPTDADVEFWIENALSDDPHVNTSDVNVVVSKGIATLSGQVKSIGARRYADLEAKKIKGVLGVINDIKVSPANLPDADIAQSIRHRIVNDVAIESEDITVTCADGVVKLSGDVSSWSEKAEAGLLASETRGVRGVRNDLIVFWENTRPDQAIADDVKERLKRDVYLVDLPIEVSVSDGVVTLHGAVGSVYEKDRASDDAHWIDNVTKVINDLKVEPQDREGTRGKAPYASDDELIRAVTDELKQDSRLHLMDPMITASYGHVTLRGSVADYQQKQIAAADIRNVVGVGWVTNDLMVKAVNRQDSTIRDDILFDIATDSALWHQGIKVKVNNGIVTLSGTVDNAHDKEHAKAVASRVRGVRAVVNTITVDWERGYADAALRKKVQDRIATNWMLAPIKDRINVSVRRGIVTLTGTVDTWGQRREAERVAFNTKGIQVVDNRLQVKGYDYSWEDWYLADPNDIPVDHQGREYPYGYYWDNTPFFSH